MHPDRVFDTMAQNYGCDHLDEVLKGKRFVSATKGTSRVLLVNPKDCENKVSLSSLSTAWRMYGGRSGCENMLAAWFIRAVVSALINDRPEADISIVFNTDFIVRGGKKISHEEITRIVLPSFKYVNGNLRKVLRLRFVV